MWETTMEILRDPVQIFHQKSVALLTTFGLAAVLYFYYKTLFTRVARVVNKFPGPPSLPFVGCGYLLPFTYGDKINMTKTIHHLFRRYGKNVCFWAGQTPYLWTKDVELIERVLGNPQCSEKSEVYQHFHFLMGQGLLTAPVDKWKVERKLLLPGFQFGLYDMFLKSYNRNAKVLVQILGKRFPSSKERCDVYADIGRCTMQIVLETMIDFPVDIQNQPEHGLVEAALICSELARLKAFEAWTQIPFVYSILGYSKLERVNIQKLRDWFEEVKKRHAKLSLELTEEERHQCCAKISFDNKDFTQDELFFHGITIIGAGFETTATVLNHTLYLLALNPECQRKIWEELDGVYGGSPRDTYLEDMGQLKYLELVIKESMRLFTPTPLLARTIPFDIQLENGMVVPKGCDILIPTWHVHHNPEIYPEPEKFIPERFLPENTKGRSRFSFIPFSEGPRACLGQKFAMMEMKVILSKLLSTFEIKTQKEMKDVRFQYGIVMHAVGGLPITLIKRK